MRIAIMGTGGVGGYFGGLLAKAGEEVVFIARGEHLDAILTKGLSVESVHGDFVVRPAQATDSPRAAGHVDLVICATKTYHIEEAARAMQPMLGLRTAVLPLQNGVDASERMAAVLGPQPVLGGLCYVGSLIAAPGVIRQQSSFRRVIVGEMPLAGRCEGPVTPRVRAIVEALSRAGAVAETTCNIQKERWTKFAFIAPFSGVGAVTRVPAGEINACPEARALVASAICEVEAVARAQGIALDRDVSEKTLAFVTALSPQITASMQRDILDGKRSELESLVGVMVRKGAELGVPVPTFGFLYAALLPLERRAS